MHSPQGGIQHYETTSEIGEHRIRRIETRFGSFLDFRYDAEDRLALVQVNSPWRFVVFGYDTLGRLNRIVDHTGRTILYEYDDWGLLNCVRGPGLPKGQPERIERYEYEQVGAVRRVSQVWDWANRLVVENFYELDDQSEFVGWVRRQIVNHGECLFDYERTERTFDEQAAARDIAVLHVIETRRSGRQVGHWLNQFGNELLTVETFVEGGRVRTAATAYRYNADGEVIAALEPDGALVQFLYGRDHLSDLLEWVDVNPTVGELSISARMSFGNLLGAISRGRRIVGQLDPLDPAFWQNRVPAVKVRDHSEDIARKYTYDPKSQLLVTQSDPRFTATCDPQASRVREPRRPEL